jgi:chromosome segregation ATPase
MANVKSNILDLNQVYTDLNKTLDENIKRLNTGAVAIERYNKVVSIKPSEYAKGLEEINTKTKQLEQSQKKLEATEKKVQQTRLQEIKLQQQREKAFDNFDKKIQASNKQIEKEQQLLEKSNSIYNKVQQKVNALSKTYNDIAIKKELGLKISAKEEAQLSSLETRLKKYQTALYNVDANIGKHQRNVGNYAGSFNGLSNSINQITRELPAFTFSAQTGFLALSNNIPILTDEIGRLIDKNKELAKQGQPVKSVFSQILGSLFSLQTAMGVGILLFTLSV